MLREIALIVPFALLTPMANADDRVIAEIGDRRITSAEIRCNPADVAARPRWLDGRTPEQACSDIERERFAALVSTELRSRACAAEGCDLSDAAVAPYRSAALTDEALREGADRIKRKFEATARVLRGEDAETVYRESLQDVGISLESFRADIGRFSLESIERVLQKDFVAMMREGFEQNAKERAMAAFLRKHVAALADAKKSSHEQAADEYLDSLREKVGVKLLDKTFRLPAGREVFR